MSAAARLALALAVALALVGAPAARAQAPPAPIALADGWEYRHDPDDRGLRGRWSRGGGGPEGWAPVTVPHVFDPRPLDWNFGGTVGWYRIELAPPAAAGFDWAIRLGQARRRARVWLNGVEIGRSESSYASVELPLRGLRPGARNVLVVRVDSRKSRLEREGWWNWGGLTRPAELVPLGQVALRDLGLLPRVRCGAEGCRASVLVDAVLTNRATRSLRPRVGVELRSPGGAVTRAALRPHRLAPGQRTRVRAVVPVAGAPELWSPESPELYDARVDTAAAGRLAQVDRLRIGLRSISVRRGLLQLNGRTLQLRGASLQEDVTGRGPALTDADVERIAQDLVAVGANVTRAHYPLDERLLRRLDELGILVWNQAPVYHADALLRRPDRAPRALAAVRAAVLAGRNHPSVIVHSVANELAAKADRMPATREFLERAAALVRGLDRTRPVALDILSYPRIARQRVYDRYDVLGVNNYFGWYPGRPPHATGDFHHLEPYLRAMRRRYRRHALVMTEFGAEAVEQGPPDLKGTYAFQSDYLARTLDVVDRNAFLGGAIYWTLHEFAVKPAWDGGLGRASLAVDAIHNKGLVAYDGTLKPAWHVARERFAATPLYR